jgi:hypothetical protein
MLQEEDNNIDLGIYGLGIVRSHKDYEDYAGINFKNKKLHKDTIQGVNPPINDYTEWYKKEEITHTLNLKIPHTENFNFIYIGVEDVMGNVLYRKDVFDYEENLKIEFKSFDNPHKWVYWVNNKEGEWVNRKDFNL